MLDYPGESFGREQAYAYVTEQQRDLITRLEELSGKRLDPTLLEQMIENSRESVAAWEKVVEGAFSHGIPPTVLFDDISFLITSRCRRETAELYEMMAEDIPPGEILRAVIWQILVQAGALLGKVKDGPVLLSGGLTQIQGFREYAQLALGRECRMAEHGNYLSAVGCALLAGAGNDKSMNCFVFCA